MLVPDEVRDQRAGVELRAAGRNLAISGLRGVKAWDRTKINTPRSHTPLIRNPRHLEGVKTGWKMILYIFNIVSHFDF